MPQLAPRVLTDASATDHSLAVGTFNNNVASFTETAVSRLVDRMTLVEKTRPASVSNQGHKLNVTLTVPHPVADQENCCVDKNQPAASYFNMDSMLSKFATSAQADDFIAYVRSYVSSAAFADLVKGGNNW